MLYEMLTGVHPFYTHNMNIKEYTEKVLKLDYEKPNEFPEYVINNLYLLGRQCIYFCIFAN